MSWSDLTTTEHFFIVKHYIEIHHITLIIAVIGLLILLGCFLNSEYKRNKHFILGHLLIFLVISPIAFMPYLDLSSYEAVTSKVSRFTLPYISWDWDENIKNNGLAIHLIQTSKRPTPSKPTSAEYEKFKTIKCNYPTRTERPKNIIMILCESCWHDETNFKNSFDPLKKLGFSSFRSLSPAYGGGTVNGSFEILTGLPAENVLTGVIYQEYATLISPRALTLPRYLKNIGYYTLNAHNFRKAFWQRDIVVPKLGFNTFLALEDMAIPPFKEFPDDKYLFKSALENIKTHNSKFNFMYLSTVYTHGPYPFNNDFGETNYKARLNTTISRIADFAKSIIEYSPESLIIVFGDHKPSLTKFFFEKKVFPKEMFDSVGQSNEDFKFKVGFNSNGLTRDVPLYVWSNKKNSLKKVATSSNHKPFFCMTQAFDSEYFHSSLPSLCYAKALCDRFDIKNEREIKSLFPPWLYYLTILNPVDN